MPGPRERILQTSTELFAKQGYNATGINQIISEANVAKASFYQHFKSKEDLCVEYLNVRHLYWFNELNAFTGMKSEITSKVLSSFDFLIHMNDKESFRGCSFLNILSEIPADNIKILDVIRRHKSDLRAYFFQIVGSEIQSDHTYLLFESCLVESKVFRSNELIVKTKEIIKSQIE